uniref:Uncharacterized protein n=1 Tax=Picocystis salinarum TaxID=88271 RepID=A0A7S3UDX1_9CHLO|mmetsp:Transcript_4481/g.15978  ORF Transcript_4481/g.15978 Transcript_4481/m.15978 type:complete len:101 (-) Transcript_4481:729-1031(-)|eukprot:CAMPEP_0113926514 /NCGR_PEP_ID=MMETSP1159-20121227/3799_1 /TAXON_ID=88271 /ORGANISM="Picocystis salinarum" /LENGTH=100 /DNA_ID=CAMNT_0000926919 /DNA_START=32 /DNA_END=334 /DNA_ORIENTATION=+ /assembly_acc=CAM_ASM_000767
MAAREILQCLTKRRMRNFYEVVRLLPEHGIGSKVQRVTWPETSYWTVMDVKPEVDGKRGKAWGTFTWLGEQRGEKKKIRGTMKKVWRPMPAPLPSGWKIT